MVRPIIDLPAPDSPTRPSTLPGSRSKLTPESTFRRCPSAGPVSTVSPFAERSALDIARLHQARIERAPQAVAEEVEAKHGHEDCEHRQDEVPCRFIDRLACIRDHLSPGRLIGADAHAD